jgi:predicted N-acetyltransferase YhbS
MSVLPEFQNKGIGLEDVSGVVEYLEEFDEVS